MEKAFTPKGYESLADLRRHIRCFLHFSELAFVDQASNPGNIN